MSSMLSKPSSFARLPGLSSNSPPSAAAQTGTGLSCPPGSNSEGGQHKTRAATLAYESRLWPNADANTPRATMRPQVPEFNLPEHIGSNLPTLESAGTGMQSENIHLEEQEDNSDELEEGELDDSQWEDEPPRQRLDFEKTESASKQNKRVTRSPKFAAKNSHPGYLQQRRQVAKAFIKASGLSYQQLVEEGLDAGMLQTLFVEASLRIQQRPSSISDSSGRSFKLADHVANDKPIAIQSTGAINREEYLARLKVLQKKPAIVKDNEIFAEQAAPTASRGFISRASHARLDTEPSPPDLAPASPVILVQRASNEQHARSMFTPFDQRLITHVAENDRRFLVYFPSAEDAQRALSRTAHVHRKDKRDKPFVCAFDHRMFHEGSKKRGYTDGNAHIPNGREDPSPYQGTPSAVPEAVAISMRKERLAQLREEALKSAKAAQARKELAATRAGQFLDQNFGTPTPSSEASALTPLFVKRSLEPEDELAGSVPLKRPFGQPRFEATHDGCIIETSDDEVESDAGRPLHNVGSTAANTSSPSLTGQHAPKSLEIHEQKISEMRKKIKALEQKSKSKYLLDNIALAPVDKVSQERLLEIASTDVFPQRSDAHTDASSATFQPDVNTWINQTDIGMKSTSSALAANGTDSAGSAMQIQQHPVQDTGNLPADVDPIPETSIDKSRISGHDTHRIVTQGLSHRNETGKSIHINEEDHEKQIKVAIPSISQQSESSMSISDDESLSGTGQETLGPSTMESEGATSDSEGLYEPPDVAAAQPTEGDVLARSNGETGVTSDSKNSTLNITSSRRLESESRNGSSYGDENFQTIIPDELYSPSNVMDSDARQEGLSQQDHGSHSASQTEDSIYGGSDDEVQRGCDSSTARQVAASEYSLSPMSEEESSLNVNLSDPHATTGFGPAPFADLKSETPFMVATDNATVSGKPSSHHSSPDEDYEPEEIVADVKAFNDNEHELVHQPGPESFDHDSYPAMHSAEDQTNDSPGETIRYQGNQDVRGKSVLIESATSTNTSQPVGAQPFRDGFSVDTDVGNIVRQDYRS